MIEAFPQAYKVDGLGFDDKQINRTYFTIWKFNAIMFFRT